MDIQEIAKCTIFSGIKPEELESILSSVPTEIKRFRKEEVLATQDESCNRLLLLVKGSVVAEMSDPSGKIVKVEDIYAPQTPAILFLFGYKNKFPVQITAREETEVLIIRKDSVLRMLSLDQRLLKNYLDISANYASVLAEKLYIMSFRTIRQKLSMYILKLSGGNEEFEMDRSQDALAEFWSFSPIFGEGVEKHAGRRIDCNKQKERFYC